MAIYVALYVQDDVTEQIYNAGIININFPHWTEAGSLHVIWHPNLPHPTGRRPTYEGIDDNLPCLIILELDEAMEVLNRGLLPFWADIWMDDGVFIIWALNTPPAF